MKRRSLFAALLGTTAAKGAECVSGEAGAGAATASEEKRAKYYVTSGPPDKDGKFGALICFGTSREEALRNCLRAATVWTEQEWEEAK